jgi:ribosomal protein S1
MLNNSEQFNFFYFRFKMLNYIPTIHFDISPMERYNRRSAFKPNLYLESGAMEVEEKTHQSIEDVHRKDKLTGKVVKIILAGAIIDIGIDATGILHISQLQEESVNKVEDVLKVGQTVEVWVKRVFPKKKRVELTMIEPLPLEWREIKEGLEVNGKITRLEKYGAFVEIGAERPGLIHISELAHGYIRTPEDAISVGEEVQVKVLSVNRRRKQIKLSIKALIESPAELVKRVQQPEPEVDKPQKPVPTAMEMAMRQAMERSQNDEEKSNPETSKKNPASTEELDGILSRTLEQKVNTGS